MRRENVHPKVISGILGHAGVTLAMKVYDRTETEDFRAPMNHVAENLFRNVPKTAFSA